MPSNETGNGYVRELKQLLDRAAADGMYLTGQYGDGEPQGYTVGWRDYENIWHEHVITLGCMGWDEYDD